MWYVMKISNKYFLFLFICFFAAEAVFSQFVKDQSQGDFNITMGTSFMSNGQRSQMMFMLNPVFLKPVTNELTTFAGASFNTVPKNPVAGNSSLAPGAAMNPGSFYFGATYKLSDDLMLTGIGFKNHSEKAGNNMFNKMNDQFGGLLHLDYKVGDHISLQGMININTPYSYSYGAWEGSNPYFMQPFSRRPGANPFNHFSVY